MPKPSQRNSTRDREKAERVALRSIVFELEAYLNALSSGANTLTRTQLQSRQSGKSAWRCLAERQARARNTAEQTNRALNEQVQSNADWIQRLWELLHEKRRAAQALAMTELPNIFAIHGVSVLDNSVRETAEDNDVWTHEQTGESQSTLVCVRRIPFDLHSTSSAVWTALSRPEGSFASESGFGSTPHNLALKARVVERTPSVCTMKVQDEIHLGGEAAVVDYHAVVHRSKLAQFHGASLFVWQSLFTLADGSVRYEDTMWAAVARGPSDSMEAFVAIVSQSELQTKPGSNDSISLQGSIMSAVQGCINSVLSSTEGMLLDESLSRPSHSNSNGNSSDETSGSITV
ncbi:Hypothetical protein PHPALM_7139 [Phytophthora palmivora]|uniref:Uncharacterized protein n=1 Tax=Phytophthora palmivora TaxID=4796 RepID=A0A2P4YDD5_9STRA|nr:Hypothetical protein PHPALM_7139 [Phytophthora palmivora]